MDFRSQEERFVSDFLIHKTAEGCEREFIRRCDFVLHDYFNFCEDIEKSITEIRLSEAKRFQSRLQSQDLSDGTVNGYVSIVRVFYNYLILVEAVGLNPFRLLSTLHVLPIEPPYMPMAQLKKVFQCLDAGYFVPVLHIAIFECLYATGITGMELMYIRPDDFSISLESLTIRATKRKPQRDVPIPAQSMYVLKHYITYRNIHHPLASFFIVSKRGKKLYYNLLNNAIGTLLSISPIKSVKQNPNVTIVKNSYRKHLLDAGVDIRTMGRLTGKRMKSLARHSGWILFADLKLNHSLYHPRA